MRFGNIMACGAPLALCLCLAVPGEAGDARQMSINALKRAYLDCERRALLDRIPTEDIARCSALYETLKQRAFDGDWIALWQWSKRALAPGEAT